MKYHSVIPGPAPGGQDEGAGGDFFLGTLLIDGADGVGVDEAGVLVEVGDLLVAELHPVAPVERPNVILNSLDKLGPVVLNLDLRDGPAIAPAILDCFA